MKSSSNREVSHLETHSKSRAQTSRPRDREHTASALHRAIQCIVAEGRPLSISAVAREAGYSAALLHNTYPEIAKEIRAKAGRRTQSTPERKTAELLAARASLRDVREQLAEAHANVAKLASINQSLREELATRSRARQT
jgi:hypothetical protein